MKNKIIKNTMIKTFCRSVVQGIALLATLSLAPFSSAAMVSLNVDDILGFSQINYSGSEEPATYQTNDDGDGVTFMTFWSLASGQASADIGSEGLTLDWSPYDTFSQSILNLDENSWNFSLSASDGTTTVTSNPIEIVTDQEQVLSVDLSSLAQLNNIEEIYVTISAELPLPGNDGVSEYQLNFQVSEVPLPASVWFFSLSVAMLVVVRRGRESLK